MGVICLHIRVPARALWEKVTQKMYTRDESLGSYGLYVVSPQTLYPETLTPLRCIRKGWVFLEVIKVRLGHEGGDCIIGSVFLF